MHGALMLDTGPRNARRRNSIAAWAPAPQANLAQATGLRSAESPLWIGLATGTLCICKFAKALSSQTLAYEQRFAVTGAHR